MRQNTQTLSSVMIAAGFFMWALLSHSSKPILTLTAVGLHEGGHILCAILCRVPLGRFRLTANEARLSLSGTISYSKELLICGAGPAVNLLCVLWATVCGGAVLGESNLSFFATVSAALAFLNLLPIGDLDGGRIYYCILAWFAGPRFALVLCNLLSFLTLFCLWSVSVYALLRVGASLSLFLFSSSLFLRIFVEGRTWRIGRIPKNKRE